MQEAANARVMVAVRESHQYGDFKVHENVQFDVHENEFLCVCGPSGCGKTTLLEIMSGLQRPTSGQVLIRGEPANPKKHNISLVFQEPSTMPWLTVRENIEVGLKVKKKPREQVRRVVDDILSVVGLQDFRDYYPHQISGGMKQRVAIARAFATDADLILMDEPFVSLDQPTRERMQREVLDIWQRRKRTVVFVTHNLEEAIFLGDRVIILSANPASLELDLEITLPRPRDQLQPEFMALRARCAGLLSELSAAAIRESAS